MKSYSKIIFITLMSFIFFSLNISANEKLEGLLKKIQDEKSQESQLWKQREAEFESEKNQQAAILAKANKDLSVLQNESLRLAKVFDQNEKSLQALEEKKNQVMGAFGELYGTLRQSAGDFNTLILNSATSAQYSKRFDAIQKLAQTKRLPEYSELENFWFLLQQEMTLQSQTPTFEADVMNEKGIKEKEKVTRVGAFNIFTGNKFLSMDIKSKNIQTYPRQPERSFTKNLDDFENTKAGALGLVSIDPSKGALLETLIQAPTLMERFHQGGLVGYVIFALLIIGFALATERIMYFSRQERQMQLQLKNMDKPLPGNPLASLIEVYLRYKNNSDSDVLSLKLSEVILHEKPKLERGLSTIKTFAGVAPLLGLLGTVTGMILTFQSITMFGSGDPKLMAGGISQALITTVLGLVCAIPLLVVYNHVNTKYQKILTFLNEQLAGMLAEVEISKDNKANS
jgi:biopolymer transport protein ExbB